MELAKGKNEARVIVVDGEQCVEIELTQGRMALVNLEDWPTVAPYRWHTVRKPDGSIYAARTINGPNGARKHRMHQLLMGTNSEKEIDHVRHPGTDNRRANLRFADQHQNQQNTDSRGGSSRYKGVNWDKCKQKWLVRFRANGKHQFVGYFDNEEEGAVAYDARVRQVAGPFARTNFIYTRAISIW